jgi:hypothetical protein
MLSQYYLAILYPFEELYKRNMPDHQKRIQMASRPPTAQFQAQAAPTMQNRPMQGVPLTQPNAPAQMQRSGNNSMNPLGQPVGPIHGSVNLSAQIPQATPVTPTQRPSSSTFSAHSSAPVSNVTSVASVDGITSIPQSEGVAELAENVLDQDVQGIKRKMEFEGDNKRARQKTGKLAFIRGLIALNRMFTQNHQKATRYVHQCSTNFSIFDGVCSYLLPLQWSLTRNLDSLSAGRSNMCLSRAKLSRMAVEI